MDMKAVLLAGGLGTRISEESHLRPKPMIDIGGRPILWHIMKIYAAHGISEFVICCGYKGYMIKEYFANYFMHMSDVTFYMEENRMEVHRKKAEPWVVTLVDTGEATMTGGRIKRVAPYIDGPFCLTYGDGVSNVDITKTIEIHKAAGRLATLTAVRPSARFGALDIQDDKVVRFVEKPEGDGRWINGGFFVCQPDVLDLIQDDSTVWEKGPLETLASSGQLTVHKHNEFWHAMDTLRDRITLQEMWDSGNAPWRIWS
jgi:glucose-1-phosphate cytidylyltransferase